MAEQRKKSRLLSDREAYQALEALRTDFEKVLGLVEMALVGDPVDAADAVVARESWQRVDLAVVSAFASAQIDCDVAVR